MVEQTHLSLAGKIVLGFVIAWNVYSLLLSNRDLLQQPLEPQASQAVANTKSVIDPELVESIHNLRKSLDVMIPQIKQIHHLTKKTSNENVGEALNQQKEAFTSMKQEIRRMRKSEAEMRLNTGGGSQTFEKQTLVLPLGPNDLERFRNLFKTLDKFFDFTSMLEWIIVMPDTGSDLAKQVTEITASRPEINLRIMQDQDVIPQFKQKPTSNWMTQQIIKLGMALHVKSTYFLVLDADVLCFKPTSFRDLIVDGRALASMYDSPHAVTRDDWWRASETVLNMKMNSPTYFGVTPAILATDLVKGVHSRIEAVHSDRDWATFLLENVYTHSFTEYCLYGVFAIASGQFHKYHIPTFSGVYNHQKSVFWKNQFESLDFVNLVENGPYLPGHFIVMQSNTEIDAMAVRQKMGHVFDLDVIVSSMDQPELQQAQQDHEQQQAQQQEQN